MTDSILRKYTGRNVPGFDADYETTEAVAEDIGPFGWLRGVRDKAIMLELRKKDGNILAVGYGWIERVAFDPSEGITLFAVGQKIRVKGRNLNVEVRPTIQLFAGIVRHRVPWVQEADQSGRLQADNKTAVIESIEW